LNRISMQVVERSMEKTDIEKRTIGVNFSADGTANIRVWSPVSGQVLLEVIGKKIIPLQKEDFGYWSAQTREISPGDKYFIILDGNRKFTDPTSLSQPDGVHGASEAISLGGYQWHDDHWKGLDAEELIIYELHVGTFSPEGNFKGVINKLDYLRHLGVTAIELMPVAQFPGWRNWGYDGVYPFAVQQSYGGAAGLRELVDACHSHGFAVILDVVYNHLGPEGNYLWAYGPYFTDRYQTPWGQAINFDDSWCDGARRFVTENALMWLRDFHIDALRLDALHCIFDFSAHHILQELKEAVTGLEHLNGRKHLLIGECPLNDVRYINSFEKGGYALDGVWCDDFHHAVHTLVTGEQNGYYADYGQIGHLVKSLRDAFVLDGTYSTYRKRHVGNKTDGHPGRKFVVCVQNHDQTGNRLHGDRLSTLVDFETLKLVAGTLFLSPFVPLLFMGEEYGEENPFLYFISHSDGYLIDGVRKGRKEEYKDFIGYEEPDDPQSEDTFRKSALSWNINENPRRALMLEYYKTLIRLRKQHPAFASSDPGNISVDQLNGKAVVLIVRKIADDILVAFINLDKRASSVGLSGFSAYRLDLFLNSAEKNWGGTQDPGQSNPLEEIVMSGRSILIFTGKKRINV